MNRGHMPLTETHNKLIERIHDNLTFSILKKAVTFKEARIISDEPIMYTAAVCTIITDLILEGKLILRVEDKP